MPEVVIHGTDVILEMETDPDVYTPVLCATDCTYVCNPEFVEKTGPASGGARQWARRLEEHISTVTGLTPIDNGTVLSFFYMLLQSIRREEHNFKMTFADEGGNLFTISGPALIGRQEINGPATDFSSGGIEIRWNGEPAMSDAASATVGELQDPLYINATAGLTYVSHVDLTQTGVNILAVKRNGITYKKTTGTPGNQEWKFDGIGTGRVYFDAANPLMADEWVYVLYEIQ